MRRVLFAAPFALFALFAASDASAQQTLTVCDLNKINKDVEQTIAHAGKRVSVTIPAYRDGNTSNVPQRTPDQNQFFFYIFDNSCKPAEETGQGFTVAWPKNYGIVSYPMVKDPSTGKLDFDKAHPNYGPVSAPSTEGGPLTVVGTLDTDGPKGELVLHLESETVCWTGGSPRNTKCTKQDFK